MAFITDLRSAIRTLVTARAFSVIAVSTLAAGIALAAIIATVVNAYVLRAMPYPASDRLYRIDYSHPGQPWPRGMESLDWASLNDVIEIPIAWDLDVFYLLGRDYPESAPGAWVTPGYMSGLGIRVAIGRTFVNADYQQGQPTVALISHRLWRSRFGADPGVIGATFNAYVSDRPQEPETFTIVGVLPADLWHVNVYTDVLAPLRAPSYPYQARLRPDVPASIASERIERLVRSGVASVPPAFRVTLIQIQESYIAQLRPVLWSLLAGAGLVVLIATANVIVLTIVRARKRERELAVRMALGASATRVARLFALEGALVAIIATALGLVIAAATVPAIASVVERVVDRRVPGGLAALSLDLRVTAIVLGCGAAIAVVLTCTPLVVLWRSREGMAFFSPGRGFTEGVGASRSRAFLIGIEVAASLTLLVGASLTAESALRMLRVDFGIEATNVSTAGLALRQASLPSEAARAEFYERLERDLHSVGATQLIAFGDWWPLQGSRPRRAETGGDEPTVATANPFAVSPRYFEALGMRVIEGRPFTSDDRLGAAPVAILSASLAARLFPRVNPLGHSFTMHSDGDEPPTTALVVGVVNDVRQSHADVDLLDAYFPLAQRASRFAFLYSRGAHPPDWQSQVRAAISRVQPEVALSTPRPLAEGLDQERVRPRFLAFLLTAFAVVASTLALVGMYGVIAFAVRQRRREIAVRMAVGADSRAVTGMFLRYGVRVLALGLATGMAGALALGQALQTQLFGVRPAEPRVLLTSVVLFGAVALAAIGWPAWRASTVDPAQVLKEE